MVERFEKFSYAIFEISRCWHKLASEEMEKHGLKGTFSVYLLALQRNDGVTAARLCELCGRDKADVSRAVSLMLSKGLVRREGSNYRAALYLTPTGQQAAQEVCNRVALAVEFGGKGFSAADREIFYRVLETVTENLQNLSKDGIPE